jgi:hypothetical protein
MYYLYQLDHFVKFIGYTLQIQQLHWRQDAPIRTSTLAEQEVERRYKKFCSKLRALEKRRRS